MTYNEALTNFLKLTYERTEEHFLASYPNSKQFPSYTVMPGRRFDKIVRVRHGSRSVHCFIEKSTGGIFKGNWKAVTLPKRPRGNIFDADPLKGTNVWGTDYLK